ncbi:hypothetical protein [Sphingomonas abaci]|uniref:Uncharacterized protein n=1 Tax=Sphingomonas abaci TaxID=237611 RepID=A0A7W7AH10_9SPHN|nr:hypothetical protein [Sphingomonas abaci]MBB4615897.1 hypothetical protein [Sphingomonas abaci]
MHDQAHTPHEPESFADMPIQPTGSGVQDLETAYEQMRLSEEEEAGEASSVVPTLSGEAMAESEAHPS